MPRTRLQHCAPFRVVFCETGLKAEQCHARVTLWCVVDLAAGLTESFALYAMTEDNSLALNQKSIWRPWFEDGYWCGGLPTALR